MAGSFWNRNSFSDAFKRSRKMKSLNFLIKLKKVLNLFISSSNITIYFCMINLYRCKTAIIVRKNWMVAYLNMLS